MKERKIKPCFFQNTTFTAHYNRKSARGQWDPKGSKLSLPFLLFLETQQFSENKSQERYSFVHLVALRSTDLVF